MKSSLGLLAAVCAGLVYVAAYGYATRAGAGWFDAQALFLIALPYNWTMLRLTGASNFSLEAPGELVGAALFDAALAYLAGALAQALVRAVRRRLKARA